MASARKRGIYKVAAWPMPALGAFLLFHAATALADLTHEHDLIIGGRAIGMGGAFCAFADDASSLFYNPGGMAYAEKSGVSGPALTH